MNIIKSSNKVYDRNLGELLKFYKKYNIGNISKFFIKLIKNNKIKNLSIPNFKINYRNRITKIYENLDHYFINKKYNNIFTYQSSFFLDNKHYTDNKIYSSIKKSLNNNNNNRFVCIFLIIKFFDKINIISHTFHNIPTLHMNLILIDKKNKTIEHYDPYGWFKPIIEKNYEVNEFIKKEIINEFKLSEYTFIDLKTLHKGQLGIQKKIKDNKLCITVTAYYLNMRLINPKKSGYQIIKYLMKLNSEKLLEELKKYNIYMGKTIHNIIHR